MENPELAARAWREAHLLHKPAAIGGFVGVILLLLASGCASDSVCHTEADCSEGFTCQDGVCVLKPDDDADMVLIPAGAFQMGCNETLDTDCQDDEKPYHEVTLAPFKIDKTEVTQAAYQACVTAGGCTIMSTATACNWDPGTRGTRPAVCATWFQAGAYCAWKNRRLPTEAEWEKAARGTTEQVFPWGNVAPTCNIANYGDCVGDTAVVGSYSSGASPYGVMDMGGNVYEWVQDWYDTGYYATSPTGNPTGPATGENRVMRGGGFGYGPELMRASNRGANPPNVQYGPLGFRCAKDAL